MQALILDQYGLAVTDARINYHANYNSPIYTKEQGSAVQPRLYIKFAVHDRHHAARRGRRT